MTTTVTIGQVPINATYTGVTGVTNGSGTGALFNVTKTNGVYTTVIDPAHLGSGYAVGDTVTIAGSSLGGGASNYDILTIGSVTTGGHIATFGSVGVGQIGNGTIYTIIDVTGSSTYTFTDKSSNFTVVNDTTNNNLIVTSVLDTTVSFKLEGVNRVTYADKSTAFDITGHAGDVYALLKAAFGGTVNQTYEGIGIRLEDIGATSAMISQAIVSTPQFATTNPDYATFVNNVYTNVMGVAPTPTQALPYVAALATGQVLESQLLSAAAHLTTFQQTIGLIGVAPATTGVLSTSGIDYIPA
jgi:hypothetical protein